MLEEFRKNCRGADDDVECSLALMRRFAASPQAIAFSRELPEAGYVQEFRKIGKVDLVFVCYPLRENADPFPMLINGAPPMIDVLAEWNDRAGVTALSAQFKSVDVVTGVQRFVFEFALKNASKATEQASFDFDATGKFLRLHRLSDSPGKKSEASGKSSL